MRRFLGFLVAFLLAACPAFASSITLAGVGKAAAGAPAGTSFIAVSVHEITTGSETYAFSCGAGCNAGDLIVIYSVNNGSMTAPLLTGSVTSVTLLDTHSDASSLTNVAWSAVLGVGDTALHQLTLSGGISNYMVATAVYRGPTVATVKDFQSASTGTTVLNFAGFVPDAATKGVVLFMNNINGANTVSVSNGTWTARSNPTTITGGFLNAYLFDQLTGYANATSTASNIDTANTKFGYEIELK